MLKIKSLAAGLLFALSAVAFSQDRGEAPGGCSEYCPRQGQLLTYSAPAALTTETHMIIDVTTQSVTLAHVDMNAGLVLGETKWVPIPDEVFAKLLKEAEKTNGIESIEISGHGIRYISVIGRLPSGEGRIYQIATDGKRCVFPGVFRAESFSFEDGCSETKLLMDLIKIEGP